MTTEGIWTESHALALRDEAPLSLVEVIDLLAEFPGRRFTSQEIVNILDLPSVESLKGILANLTLSTKRLGIPQDEKHSWFVLWERIHHFQYWLTQERADWWSGQSSRKFWAFAANPKNYQIENAVSALKTDWWNIAGSSVSVGDAVLIWKTLGGSQKRGVIALAEVLEGPIIRSDSDNKFWINDPRSATQEPRVLVRYHPLPGGGTWITDSEEDPLSVLTVSRSQGGTVFKVSPSEWDLVLGHIGGWPLDKKSDQEADRRWTREEREITVESYMDMFKLELNSETYSKAAHRRAIVPQLDSRSEGAVEYKHRNISAVLIELGLPYISGYKPADNFQRPLRRTVEAYLDHDHELVSLLTQLAEGVEPVLDPPLDLESVFENPPAAYVPTEVDTTSHGTVPSAVRVDYLAREARNRKLGDQGEEYVLKVEKERLTAAGREDLADRTEWVAKTKGDGLGYDVRSFKVDGKPLFIEVKTTKGSKATPFVVSSNEVVRSCQLGEGFRLYRVYNFPTAPRVFVLSGPLESVCHLVPTQYRARFSGHLEQ